MFIADVQIFSSHLKTVRLNFFSCSNLSVVFLYSYKSLASEKQFPAMPKKTHLPTVMIPSPVACFFLSALLFLPNYPLMWGWDTVGCFCYPPYTFSAGVYFQSGCIIPQSLTLCYSESAPFLLGLTASDLRVWAKILLFICFKTLSYVSSLNLKLKTWFIC